MLLNCRVFLEAWALERNRSRKGMRLLGSGRGGSFPVSVTMVTNPGGGAVDFLKRQMIEQQCRGQWSIGGTCQAGAEPWSNTGKHARLVGRLGHALSAGGLFRARGGLLLGRRLGSRAPALGRRLVDFGLAGSGTGQHEQACMLLARQRSEADHQLKRERKEQEAVGRVSARPVRR